MSEENNGNKHDNNDGVRESSDQQMGEMKHHVDIDSTNALLTQLVNTMQIKMIASQNRREMKDNYLKIDDMLMGGQGGLMGMGGKSSFQM